MKRVLSALGLLAAGAATIWLVARPSGLVSASAGVVTITWEAEDANAIDEPFRVRERQRQDKRPRPQVNSGRGYVEIPDKANGTKPEGDGSDLPGFARFRVRVPSAGAYKLWARVYWPNGCGNSFFVRQAGRPKRLLGETGNYDTWDWVALEGQPLALQAGVNVIEVLNREDGVIVDEMQLTTGNVVPTGAVRPTPNALARD